MKLLIINSGSSSLKYQLVEIDGTNYAVHAKGIIEKIGEAQPRISHEAKGEKKEFKRPVENHDQAIPLLDGLLTGSIPEIGPDLAVISSMHEIEGIGHRVVHGGKRYINSVIIDDEVIAAIDSLRELAPLHNPPNLKGIIACKYLGVSQVAAFDTSFHHTMQPEAYTYALPAGLEGKNYRRYGFHGLSHRYVNELITALYGSQFGRRITAHLGNGCSITAIKDGNVIDTSMGYSPLEGLVSGSREPLPDTGLVLALAKEYGPDAVLNMLWKQSGLFGLTGSNDMRDVFRMADSKDEAGERARLALEVYALRVKKYIGAYAFELGGVDTVVFTAGVGENSARMRAMILQGLEHFGIRLDTVANQKANGSCPEIVRPMLISNGPVKVYAVRTDEEKVIARDTYNLLKDIKR